MKTFYPSLLSRQKSMLYACIGRKRLEKLAKEGLVRTFTTKGGHKRYFRDDLNKFIYEQEHSRQG